MQGFSRTCTSAPQPETSFWKRRRPEEMTIEEWEALCDGCARCCLQKMEEEGTGRLYYTRIVCRYLEEKTCRCTQYARRGLLVPTCLLLTPQNIACITFLPSTCAYRLIREGKDLPEWHPLVSGSRHSVHEAGISVRGKVIGEEYVHPDGWDEHIVDWVE